MAQRGGRDAEFERSPPEAAVPGNGREGRQVREAGTLH
jgi:hypothetical protein